MTIKYRKKIAIAIKNGQAPDERKFHKVKIHQIKRQIQLDPSLPESIFVPLLYVWGSIIVSISYYIQACALKS